MTSAPVTDLKYFQPVRHRFGNTRKEMTHVYWQTDIFTSHGLHAHCTHFDAALLAIKETTMSEVSPVSTNISVWPLLN